MFILLVLNEPSLPAPPGLQLQRLANKCMRSDLIRYKPVPVLLASKISFLPPTTPISRETPSIAKVKAQSNALIC